VIESTSIQFTTSSIKFFNCFFTSDVILFCFLWGLQKIVVFYGVGQVPQTGLLASNKAELVAKFSGS